MTPIIIMIAPAIPSPCTFTNIGRAIIRAIPVQISFMDIIRSAL